MKLFWSVVFLLSALPAFAQNLSTAGNITKQTSSCSGAGAGYVYYQLPPKASAVAVTLAGTWSGTAQFAASVDDVTWASIAAVPLAGGAAVTSATGNGTWTVNPAGAAWFCVYASSYASGTVAVSMSAQTAVGAVTAAAIQGALGFVPAANGSNSDITALNGLTSPVPAPGFYLNTLAAGPVAVYFDDFFTSAGTTPGNIGSPTGASCSQNTTYMDQNHPGNMVLTSGTGGTGTGIACTVELQGAVGSSNPRTIFTPNSSLGWTWSSAVYVAALPGTTVGAYQAGMAATYVVNPWTTGIGWYLSSANGVANDWYCAYSSTYTDSGIAATVAWARLGMVNDGTYIHWYVNGVEATGCKVAIASASSSTMALAWTSTALSGTSVAMAVDYVYFQRAVSR